MTDDRPFYAPDFKLVARQPTRGEPLFEFVRASDGAPMACELRFHGQSYGWEAQILERGGQLFIAHGGFPLCEMTIVWAEAERRAIERQS